jgi:hypothetical protein
MNSNDPSSSDFSYQKYSLQQLDNWVNDAVNCEDLTPQDIYDTIVKCVDESVEYHKKYYTKSVELFSLLKGNRSVEIDTSLDDIDPSSGVSPASQRDWQDFWHSPEAHGTWDYSREEVRNFELKERDYERQRAELDADYNKELEEIRAAGGYEWTPGT